jgi:hypothetical protein
MKKILLIVDGTNYSKGAFEFVSRLNELEPVLVTGVFAPQLDYANLWSYAAAAGSGAVYVPLLEEEENDEVARNIARFEAQCLNNNIRYRVHKDFYDFALPELKRESRFADVMVLSGELFYKEIITANQFDYMKTVLHQSECPVVVVPEDLQFPLTNILAYDGSEESVYALKQFAYIFPELAKNKTLLVYAEEEEASDFPSKNYIVELATQHFPDLTFYKLEINPKRYFATWIGEQKSAILISGSFARSAFSQAFKKSFVADIISEHQVPVFVAHK